MTRTKDGLKIIDRMIGDDVQLRRMVAEETVNAAVAQIIYDARKKAGLTQKELADVIGTKQPAIARLEDADYDGHSLSMLNRIAKALNLRLSVQLTAAEPQVDAIRYAFHQLMSGLRKATGLSVDDLAKRTGVEREEILSMERNPAHKPQPRTLHRLAKFYSIPQQRLLQLAGAIKSVPEDLEQEACRFAAHSESFAKLTREERRLLDNFVKFLQAKTQVD